MTDKIEINEVEGLTVTMKKDGKIAFNNLSTDELSALALVQAEIFGSSKTGVWHEDNRNLIGGIIGVGVSVGLELVSPTGSKTSALAAAAAGATTLYAARKIIDLAPQNNTIAATTAATSMLISATAGRIVADYFPGYLESE